MIGKASTSHSANMCGYFMMFCWSGSTWQCFRRFWQDIPPQKLSSRAEKHKVRTHPSKLLFWTRSNRRVAAQVQVWLSNPIWFEDLRWLRLQGEKRRSTKVISPHIPPHLGWSSPASPTTPFQPECLVFSNIGSKKNTTHLQEVPRKRFTSLHHTKLSLQPNQWGQPTARVFKRWTTDLRIWISLEPPFLCTQHFWSIDRNRSHWWFYHVKNLRYA